LAGAAAWRALRHVGETAVWQIREHVLAEAAEEALKALRELAAFERRILRARLHLDAHGDHSGFYLLDDVGKADRTLHGLRLLRHVLRNGRMARCVRGNEQSRRTKAQ